MFWLLLFKQIACHGDNQRIFRCVDSWRSLEPVYPDVKLLKFASKMGFFNTSILCSSLQYAAYYMQIENIQISEIIFRVWYRNHQFYFQQRDRISWMVMIINRNEAIVSGTIISGHPNTIMISLIRWQSKDLSLCGLMEMLRARSLIG